MILMGHYVYKYVNPNTNEILYIGKNDTNLVSRLKQHCCKGDNIPSEYHDELLKADIYFITLANNIMCDVVESELIRRYKPKCNSSKMSDWDGLDFVEPKWTKVDKDYNNIPTFKSRTVVRTDYKKEYDKLLFEYNNLQKIANAYKSNYEAYKELDRQNKELDRQKFESHLSLVDKYYKLLNSYNKLLSEKYKITK